MNHRRILILADIEGSSGCRDYASGKVTGPGWPEACRRMSLDVDAVVSALFEAGAEAITVKDFHRTGYNLLPEYIHHGARLVSGYCRGPVPGIGHPGRATGLVMLGMHAPSGADGFLPHTLTSRIARLAVNGRLMSEAELFSASLAPFGLAPLFLSGCPHACGHALRTIPGIRCFSIEKPGNPPKPERLSGDMPAPISDPDIRGWRQGLARSVATAAKTGGTVPFEPSGPFSAAVTFRDGPTAARTVARRWALRRNGATISFETETFGELYDKLICLAYLTPLTRKTIGLGLPLFNLMGRAGRMWARLSLSRG